MNTPLFSLHSKQSGGIGEFTDLLPLISWCKEIGLSIIQLLPLNDTGQDTSPYNAVSSCALNPLHLCLSCLPGKDKHPDLFKKLDPLKILNLTPNVDYPKVREAKLNWLRDYFAIKHNDIPCDEFVKENPWVKGYALFRALKDKQQWTFWEEWPAEYVPANKEAFDKLYQQFQNDAEFYIFVQYLCFQQLCDVKKQAQQAGILIKGDIPILISPDSADVWLEKHLFRLDLAAGAPPDMYSKEGQYWGFPLYNWTAMDAENNRWWIERIKLCQKFLSSLPLRSCGWFFSNLGCPKRKKSNGRAFRARRRKKMDPRRRKNPQNPPRK